MKAIFSSNVVKRLKRDWIRTLYAFVHMIMSLHKMKNGPSLRQALCQHFIQVNDFITFYRYRILETNFITY
jgi:hypothetical protein